MKYCKNYNRKEFIELRRKYTNTVVDELQFDDDGTLSIDKLICYYKNHVETSLDENGLYDIDDYHVDDYDDDIMPDKTPMEPLDALIDKLIIDDANNHIKKLLEREDITTIQNLATILEDTIGARV